jgi:hypothetical protein
MIASVSAGISLVILVILIVIVFILYYLWGAITLLFVSDQFNEADRKGAREELRRMKTKDSSVDIMSYLGGDPTKTQVILQYVYIFNRIGVGICYRALRSDIIFRCWLPTWFIDTWETLKPLIDSERQRRKLPEFANSAEWLVNECRKKIRQ